MANGTGNHGVESKPQTAWGAWVVFGGLLAVAGIFALAVTVSGLEKKDVAVVAGAAFGVIGSLVGAYFGIRGTTLATGQTMHLMTQELGARIDQTKEVSEEAKASSAQAQTASAQAQTASAQAQAASDQAKATSEQAKATSEEAKATSEEALKEAKEGH